MSNYSKAFNAAMDHLMLYEVGGFWKLTPDVQAGLCDTPQRSKAVGYTNDPVDPGGETKFGVAKNANPTLDIKAMTFDEAKEVYYQHYWLAGACDKLPARLAVLHFDGCANHGVKKASMFLQEAAGAKPDGSIGPITLRVIANADESTLCNSICDRREQFYNNIVAAKPSQIKYLKGWLRRIAEMRSFVLDQSINFN